MEKKDVRIPQQKRSIEKKEKIIEAAYSIFTENGYFSTNTAQIAKKAGLSTGSIYAYFSDKKDILLACLYKFGESLTEDICDKMDSLSTSGDILNVIKKVLGIFVKLYGLKRPFHNEIISLQYMDEDVKNYFIHVEKSMMKAISGRIQESGYTFRHEREQTFLMFQMVKGIEDELAFDHSPDINQNILIDECAHTIISMLIKNENK